MTAFFRRLKIVGIVTLLAMLLWPTATVNADVNDFVINRFAADYTLTNADKQGQLKITENIEVTFTDNNHGILRALPNTYKDHKLQLDIQTVRSKTNAPAQYDTYQQGGNTVIKIGDPDQTVTGKQQYTIQYTVNNVVSFYGDHDELYWDINGDQWDQVVQEVSVTVHLPFGTTQISKPSRCYAGGGYGSLANKCEITDVTGDASVIARTTQPLAARQTLSIVFGFEKGFFQPSTWRDTLSEYAGYIVSFAIPFVLLGGGAGLLWFKRGRDAPGRGVIVPQYAAPKGLSPLRAGTLIDFTTDARDITATIVDLAIRRYITIIEQTKPQRFRKDITIYKLRLDNPDITALDKHEQALMKGIFSDLTPGKEVDLATLKYKLATEAEKIRKNVSKELHAQGYYASDYSFLASFGMWGTIIGVMVITGFIASMVNATGAFVFGAIAGGLLAGVFIALMQARTAKGVLAKEHLKGLEMYLKTAETDRIKLLQAPNARYAANAHEPTRTVELFEKLLPYAMVLGVEKQWAKQFEDIYRAQPDWYSGNYAAFNAGYLASSLSGGVSSAVNSAFSTASNSSGSGFSGGGSGGGGGGGGGGGW